MDLSYIAAIRHLFYARFIAHFLHGELGLLPCREPFRRFLPVGLVLGRTFKSPTTGQFFPPHEVILDQQGKPHPHPPPRGLFFVLPICAAEWFGQASE